MQIFRQLFLEKMHSAFPSTLSATEKGRCNQQESDRLCNRQLASLVEKSYICSNTKPNKNEQNNIDR